VVEISLSAPNVAYPDGRLLLDQLGTTKVTALITTDSSGKRQINANLEHAARVLNNPAASRTPVRKGE
jgi:hypothetical protein